MLNYLQTLRRNLIAVPLTFAHENEISFGIEISIDIDISISIETDPHLKVERSDKHKTLRV